MEDRVADGDPIIEGGIRYVSGTFRFKDAQGLYDPRAGGGGVTETQHKILRQLIHFINEGPGEGFVTGSYRETLPVADPFPTSVVWWESASKLKKIFEILITRTGGGATNVTPTPVVYKIYDTDGITVLATASDAISYTGVFETSRTRTFS